MCGTSQGGDTARDVGHTGGAHLQQSAGHGPAVGQAGFVGAGFRTRGRREVMEPGLSSMEHESQFLPNHH